MDGSLKEIENACKTVVDVRDVAKAHVEAALREELVGQRLLLVAGSPHFEEVVAWPWPWPWPLKASEAKARYIREALPEELKGNVPSKVSDRLGPAVMGPAPPLPVKYDASEAEKLFGPFISVEMQVKSMVQSMLLNGFKSAEQYMPSNM